MSPSTRADQVAAVSGWLEMLPAGVVTDPWFYAVAVPAAFLIGLSKSGFAQVSARSPRPCWR